MTAATWRWARPLGGAAILAVLVWRVGAGPFLDGVRMVDGWSLAAAVGIAALTTVCCAWRWSLVAHGLGLDVPLGAAVAAYYRSQFLNTTLPGGVLGDVHRGVRHGRDVGDTPLALRAVVWDRVSGQVVLVVLAVSGLLVLPSPLHSSLPVLVAVPVAVLVALAGGAAWLGRVAPSRGPSLWARTARAVAADLHSGMLARRAWPGIVLASAVAVAGHVTTFLIAARSAGATAPVARLLPLALVVLLAMAIPANVAGWGPREGVAAWAFATAGLGAELGVATAVVYGVMVLAASLPGAGVLVAAARREGAGHG